MSAELEPRYTNIQAAERIGVTKNTIYRWERRKAAGEPRYSDFPAARRIKHSNHRYYTEADIARIVAWMNVTEAAEPVATPEAIEHAR